MSNVNELLKEKLTTDNYNRLMAVDNLKIHKFVADAIELTSPESVFVCTDSKEDVKYVRRMAAESGKKSRSKHRGIRIISTGRTTRAGTGK